MLFCLCSRACEQMEETTPTAFCLKDAPHLITTRPVTVKMTMLQLNTGTVLALRDEAHLDFSLDSWVWLPVGADVPGEHQARRRFPREHDAPVTRASIVTALIPAAPDTRLDHRVHRLGLADLVIGQRPPSAHLLREHSPCHSRGRLNAHDLSHAIGIGTGGHGLLCVHGFSYDVCLLPCSGSPFRFCSFLPDEKGKILEHPVVFP